MVLIVNERRRDANAVSEMFYYMGILSLAVTPHEALCKLNGYYRAVVIMEPARLPDPVDFVRRLRTYARVPIFGISDDIANFKYNNIFEGTFKFSILSSTLAGGIINYCQRNNLPVIGDYRVAGLNASSDLKNVRYFSDEIKYTKTETMVLRYLIVTYPCPINAKSIIKNAFKVTKQPESACIRTQICVINRKFRDLTGRYLITHIPRQGYVLLTPQTKELFSL